MTRTITVTCDHCGARTDDRTIEIESMLLVDGGAVSFPEGFAYETQLCGPCLSALDDLLGQFLAAGLAAAFAHSRESGNPEPPGADL